MHVDEVEGKLELGCRVQETAVFLRLLGTPGKLLCPAPKLFLSLASYNWVVHIIGKLEGPKKKLGDSLMAWGIGSAPAKADGLK